MQNAECRVQNYGCGFILLYKSICLPQKKSGNKNK